MKSSNSVICCEWITLLSTKRGNRFWGEQLKIMFTFIITAPKRSLRRLCFHRCLSIHEGMSATPPPHSRHTPLGRHTPQGRPSKADTPPSGQTHSPLGRNTPPSGQTHPLGRPPWAATPLPSACWDTHTPCPVQAGIRSTSGWYVSHWNAFLLMIFFWWNVFFLILPQNRLFEHINSLQCYGLTRRCSPLPLCGVFTIDLCCVHLVSTLWMCNETQQAMHFNYLHIWDTC